MALEQTVEGTWNLHYDARSEEEDLEMKVELVCSLEEEFTSTWDLSK